VESKDGVFISRGPLFDGDYLPILLESRFQFPIAVIGRDRRSLFLRLHSAVV